MKLAQKPHLITILICIYCVLNSLNLVETWINSRADRIGALAFILWITPVILFWIRQFKQDNLIKDRPILLAIGLFCSFNGMAGSLHVLEHIGLAFTISALLPSSRLHPVWLASSIAWLPAFSWIGGRFFPEYLTIARIVIATLPASFIVHSVQRLAWRQP